MATNKYFDCPYCGKRMTREDMVVHIEKKHMDQVPEGYTPLRITFNTVNHRPMDYNGICTECKGPTGWDENKGRYNRQCGKKSCHDSYIKKFEENAKRKNGYARPSENPEGLERMLAGRRISGEYKFQDGGVKTYTGSYEKKTLEFMDVVMNCKSDDIITPGPVFSYQYNGETHTYISDILYLPYNLIIEVKDGGDRPNTRNMPEYRAKQVEKEKHIINNTDYNYLRLTNNDFGQLLAVMMDLKMQLVDGTGKRVIHVNENMFSAIGGMIPPVNADDVYVVNYLKKNSFCEDEPDIAVSGTPTFDTVFFRDKHGIMRKGNQKTLENCEYDVYLVPGARKRFQENACAYLNQFIPYGFLYEAVFEKKQYTWDQIRVEESAIPVPDIYSIYHSIKEVVSNSMVMGTDLLVENGDVLISTDFSNGTDHDVTTYMRIKDGGYYVEGMLLNGQPIYLNTEDPNQKQLFRSLGGNIDG